MDHIISTLQINIGGLKLRLRTDTQAGATKHTFDCLLAVFKHKVNNIHENVM